MVRFAPPPLARLVTLALQARVHHDGLAPATVGAPRAAAFHGPLVAELLAPPSPVGYRASQLMAAPQAEVEAVRPQARWRRAFTKLRWLLSRVRRPEGRAYALFERDFCARHPDLTAFDAIRMASREWRRMGAKERAPFVKRAAKGYRLDKRDAEPTDEEAYQLFLSKAREANPRFTDAEVLKFARNWWREMAVEERAPFYAMLALGSRPDLTVDAAEEERQAQPPAEEAVDTPRRALREEYEPSGEEFAEDEAYALFVADTGAANPQMALDEASQLAVSQWRAMSIRQRAPFYAMVALGMTAGTPVSDDVVSEVAHDQSSEEDASAEGESPSATRTALRPKAVEYEPPAKQFVKDEAFMIFDSDFAARNRKFSREGASSMAASKWIRMSIRQRAPFYAMAALRTTTTGASSPKESDTLVHRAPVEDTLRHKFVEHEPAANEFGKDGAEGDAPSATRTARRPKAVEYEPMKYQFYWDKAFKIFEADFVARLHPSSKVETGKKVAASKWMRMTTRQRAPFYAMVALGMTATRTASLKESATPLAHRAPVEDTRVSASDAVEESAPPIAKATLRPKLVDAPPVAKATLRPKPVEFEPAIKEFAKDEAFMLFAADVRAFNPRLTSDEALKLAVSKWSAMSFKQRAPFYAMVAAGTTTSGPTDVDELASKAPVEETLVAGSETAHDPSSEAREDAMVEPQAPLATLRSKPVEYEPAMKEFVKDEAYMIFDVDFAARHPRFSRDGASRVAASKWSRMSSRQRAPFYAMVALGRSAETFSRMHAAEKEALAHQISEEAKLAGGGEERSDDRYLRILRAALNTASDTVEPRDDEALEHVAAEGALDAVGASEASCDDTSAAHAVVAKTAADHEVVDGRRVGTVAPLHVEPSNEDASVDHEVVRVEGPARLVETVTLAHDAEEGRREDAHEGLEDMVDEDAGAEGGAEEEESTPFVSVTTPESEELIVGGSEAVFDEDTGADADTQEKKSAPFFSTATPLPIVSGSEDLFDEDTGADADAEVEASAPFFSTATPLPIVGVSEAAHDEDAFADGAMEEEGRPLVVETIASKVSATEDEDAIVLDSASIRKAAETLVLALRSVNPDFPLVDTSKLAGAGRREAAEAPTVEQPELELTERQ